MQQLFFDNITIDQLPKNIFGNDHIEVAVLRSDKIHAIISGNKWFKLKYYLEDARLQKKKTIVTFGGAWSNHIVAAAAACQLNGLNATGIIRGEEPPELSPTLRQAKEMGMQLIFISREDYKIKKIPVDLLAEEHYLINEGGYGLKGAIGAAEMLENCQKENYTHIACAAGTGTMLAGLTMEALPQQQVIGISVLKNNYGLEENVRSLLNNTPTNFRIAHDYHFGGYANHTKELLNFMNEFYRETNIPSDFVYTGKLFFAITDLTRKNYFPPGSRLLVIHSGGLQGNASLEKGTLIF
jgi:1-aminocyclopropane-1-carboxylate deaminase/D-cysteine desulfhydrase-like pyridoxal-dependent ACC family enzyme